MRGIGVGCACMFLLSFPLALRLGQLLLLSLLLCRSNPPYSRPFPQTGNEPHAQIHPRIRKQQPKRRDSKDKVRDLRHRPVQQQTRVPVPRLHVRVHRRRDRGAPRARRRMNSTRPRRRLRCRVLRAEDAVGGALVRDERVDCQGRQHECVYSEEGTNLDSEDENENEGEVWVPGEV